MNTTGGRKAATLDGRADKGLGQLGRIGRLGAEPKKQAITIRTKVHVGTFYGFEGSDVTDRQVAALSPATADVIKRGSNRHDVDWFYRT